MAIADKFYEHLEGFSEFSQFTQLELYRPLPSTWFVLITDVKGSTNAIEDGLYKEVNSLGVASIVALLNAVSPLKVPYVFGGDGATVCIPPSSKAAAESALVATKQMAKDNFGLDLRIGMVAMKEIEAAGHQIFVGKYQPSDHFQQAMFQGDGLRHAESLIKDPEIDNPFQQAMFQGDGISHAESLIKDPSIDNPFIMKQMEVLKDLNAAGMKFPVRMKKLLQFWFKYLKKKSLQKKLFIKKFLRRY